MTYGWARNAVGRWLTYFLFLESVQDCIEARSRIFGDNDWNSSKASVWREKIAAESEAKQMDMKVVSAFIAKDAVELQKLEKAKKAVEEELIFQNVISTYLYVARLVYLS